MHQKLCWFVSGASVLAFFLFLSGFVTFVYFGNAPVLNQTQPVYGDVIYSPFSNLDNRYNHIEVALGYDRVSESNKFNFTICQASCPLKTHIKKVVYDGSCSIERQQYNCYAKLSDEDTKPDSYARCFSKFMLKNSKIRFNITELNETLSAQLCITTNIEQCRHVFWPGDLTQLELQQSCVKLITFNKTNHFTQTFIAPDDSYYCAVWVLEADQWLYYIVSSNIEGYSITDYSPHLCASHTERPSHVTFPLHLSKPAKTVCIVLQQNTVDRDLNTCDSITINSTALRPLSTVAWTAFSVIMGFSLVFCILISFIIIFFLMKSSITQY